MYIFVKKNFLLQAFFNYCFLMYYSFFAKFSILKFWQRLSDFYSNCLYIFLNINRHLADRMGTAFLQKYLNQVCNFFVYFPYQHSNKKLGKKLLMSAYEKTFKHVVKQRVLGQTQILSSNLSSSQAELKNLSCSQKKSSRVRNSIGYLDDISTRN